jgi:hypothetical protein
MVAHGERALAAGYAAILTEMRGRGLTESDIWQAIRDGTPGYTVLRDAERIIEAPSLARAMGEALYAGRPAGG